MFSQEQLFLCNSTALPIQHFKFSNEVLFFKSDLKKKKKELPYECKNLIYIMELKNQKGHSETKLDIMLTLTADLSQQSVYFVIVRLFLFILNLNEDSFISSYFNATLFFHQQQSCNVMKKFDCVKGTNHFQKQLVTAHKPWKRRKTITLRKAGANSRVWRVTCVKVYFRT